MGTLRRRRPAVVTTYTPADLIASRLGDYITQPEPTGDGEMRMFCPICEVPGESRTPSASINPALGKWHCLGKCGEGGSIAALAQELGVAIRGTGSRASKQPKKPKKPTLPEPLDDQNKPLDWHDQLERGGGAAVGRLRDLLDDRGILPETRSRAYLGASGEQLTIPMRERSTSPWVQTKFIAYDGKGGKAVTQTPGAVARLWPAEWLDEAPTLPVLLCEGETDCLLAEQESRGRYVAVAVTGGAKTLPYDLDRLRGREVFVAFDCDDTGRAGMERIVPALRAAGARARALDLTRLGLPATEKRGADLSDYFRAYGGTADALAVEMERLRSDPDADGDEVAAAMRAAFLDLGQPQTDYTAALLSEDDILTAPPLRYVVEPWLPVGMFTSMFGQPGSGKTFVGQDMQNAVRAGIPWHGHDVEPGAVLLLEAEGVQQLQARIVAWNEHHGNPDMAAFRALDVPLDLSTPEGAAALVRTVRGMETATGEHVVLVWIDPAALYMSSSENEDGNRNLALGLNAVAKYLDIAVLVIVHTNAEGSRARGTDHFRMLSGSHVRVERIDGDRVGVVQEKVKNTSPRAVILRPVEVGRSIALDTEERMSALEYASRKDRATWTAKTTLRLSEARTVRHAKDTEARDMLLAVVAADPGVVQGKLLARCKGRNVGHDVLLANLDALIAEGEVRIETVGTGKNAPKHHYLADGATP